MRISVLIGAALALLAAGSSWAAPAQKQCTDEDRREGLRCPSIRERGQDDLPVPSGQEIGAFQQVCDAAHGFKTFSKQVGCIKGLISSSGAYGTQPEVTLYVLTADKLVEDVRSGRLRSAEARVELQKAYLAELDREQARVAEQKAEIAREEERRAAAERERREAAAEENARREAENARREAEREQYSAAVGSCIGQARERRAAALQAQTAGLSGQDYAARMAGYSLGASLNPGYDQAQCQNNPNWYQSIPIPNAPQVTRCQRDYMGQVTCVSQ